MADTTNTYDTELSNELEATKVAESSEAQNTDEPESQEENTESTESDKEEARNSKRVQKINSMLTKIELGEATIDDAEPWMRDDLQTKLGRGKASESDVEKVVKQQLQAIKEEEQFDKLNRNITGLTDEKDKVLKSKYNELREAGLSKYQSLEISMKYAGVESTNSTIGKSVAPGRVATPKGIKSFKDMTDDEIVSMTLSDLPN